MIFLHKVFKTVSIPPLHFEDLKNV